MLSPELQNALLLNETDLDGAMERFYGNDTLYLTVLKGFLNDETMKTLKRAVLNQEWDAAFTAAHALKGLAGNLGFTPLFHSIGELVIVIRAGRIDEAEHAVYAAEKCYDEITSTIKTYCTEGEVKK